MGTITGILLLSILSWKINISRTIGVISGVIIGLFCSIAVYLITSTLPLIITLFLEGTMIIVVTLIIIAFRFFRDPDRIVPDSTGNIVSPADGTIRYIHQIEAGEIPFAQKKKRSIALKEFAHTALLDSDGIIIGIEMSVLDVHVNRTPISGKIVYQEAHPGPFYSLRTMEAITQNERMSTVIKHGKYNIGMVQIASRLVRRIVSYVLPDQQMETGERIGMIKFGSQVDIILPLLPDLCLKIKEGQHVLAGKSLLATWNDED